MSSKYGFEDAEDRARQRQEQRHEQVARQQQEEALLSQEDARIDAIVRDVLQDFAVSSVWGGDEPPMQHGRSPEQRHEWLIRAPVRDASSQTPAAYVRVQLVPVDGQVRIRLLTRRPPAVVNHPDVVSDAQYIRLREVLRAQTGLAVDHDAPRTARA